MKSFSLFILFGVLHSGSLLSQSGRSITVKAGEDIAQAWSPNGFYRFPQFSKAAVFYKAGDGPSELLFNYNVLSANIQFINEAGDTLEMINPTLFDSIVIDKTVFYYKDGFVELVATTHPVRLVKKTTIKMRTETIGAYGISNSTAAIDKISSYSIGTNVYHFSINQDIIVKENIDWLWIDENGKMLKATKVNLLLLLPPGKQDTTKAFMKQNKINFEKEDDLKRLLAWL